MTAREKAALGFRSGGKPIAVAGVAYFLAQILVFGFPHSLGPVTAIWPAAGVGLASFLLIPRRYWPALATILFAAGLSANLFTSRPWFVSMGFMVANITESSASAWLLTRLCGERVDFSRVRHSMVLAFVVVFVNALTALIGAGAAYQHGGSQFWDLYQDWWIGDGLGLLLVTPLVVVGMESWQKPGQRRVNRIVEAMFLLALSSVVAVVEFAWHKEFIRVELAPFWLPIFLTWAALRLGRTATVTIANVFSFIVITCTAAGLGSFPLGGANAIIQLESVQIYLGVISMTGFILAAAISQQRQSEALLRAVVEGTTDAVYVKDRQGRYLLFNSAASRFVGKQGTEILGHDDTAFFPPEEAKALMVADRTTMAGATPRTYEENLTGPSGNPLIFSSTKGPLLNEYGETIGLFGIAREISDQKAVEMALRKQKKQYQQLFESMFDGFALHEIICDATGQPVDYRFLTVNPAFERQTGLRAADVIGRRIREIMPGIEQELIERYGRVAQTGESVGFEQYSVALKRHFEVTAFRPSAGQFATFLLDVTEKKLAEQALREREERYQRITEAITDYIFTVSVREGEARETRHGPGCRAVTGYDPEDFAADPRLWLHMVAVEDRGAVEQHARQILQEVDVPVLEHRLIHKDGSVRWVSNTIVPHRDAAGRLIGYDGLIQDITARKEAELALRESEQKFARVFNDAPVWITISDMADARILEVNDSFLEASGFGREEIIGQTAVKLGWIGAAERGDMARQLGEAGRFSGMEVTVHRKDGKELQALANGELIEHNGRPCMLVVALDTTDRVQSVAALQESNFFLSKAQEVAQLGSFTYDIARDRWTGSPMLDEILGIDLGYQRDFAGWIKLVAPDQQQEVSAYFTEHVLERRQRFDRDYSIRRASDAKELWVHGTGELDIDAAGRPIRLIGTIQDITEQRRAERALKESEKNLQEAQVLAKLGSWHVEFDPAGDRWIATPELRRIYGRPADKPLPINTWFEVIHPDDRKMVEDLWQRFLHGKEPVETEHRIVIDGRTKWVSVKASIKRDPVTGRPVEVSGTSQDISERKLVEVAHARLAAAVEQSAETIVITDITGKILYANPAFEKSSGYTVAEALGRNPRMLRSGKQEPAFYVQMWQKLVNKEVWSGRIINRRKDGKEYEEDVSIAPVLDSMGRIMNYVAVKRDITREVLMEAQFRQAQKMEAIGQLAGGVAHDFNNILAAVMLHIGLIQMESSLEPSLHSSLKELAREVKRGASLTRQLLAFSRQQAMEPVTLELNGVVAGLLNMLRRLLGEDIAIDFVKAGRDLLIRADPGMIEQVVINLSINARDAMPRGGRLTLRTEGIEINEASVPEIEGARAGRFVHLSVVDTGTGIAPDTLQRIFEPFFTTKEKGKGTGLGLSTVYGIVQQHHGWVGVESALGQGTTFHIYFPCGDPADLRNAAEEESATPWGKGESILVVEDEVGLRATVGAILRRNNYQVTEAIDGPSAVAIWKREGMRFDLVLTDMIMPGGMTGHELIEHFLTDRPTMKIIATTGYTSQDPAMGSTLSNRISVVRKPFGPSELLAAVRTRLDQT